MSEGASDGARLEAVAVRRPQKSEAAFRTISEVSEDLDVPQHVLRFWESRFQTIKPLKRGGGRRYYRPEDVLLLRRIRDLLYKDGYTIRGVQKLLREQTRGGAAIIEEGGESAPGRPSRFDTAERCPGGCAGHGASGARSRCDQPGAALRTARTGACSGATARRHHRQRAASSSKPWSSKSTTYAKNWPTRPRSPARNSGRLGVLRLAARDPVYLGTSLVPEFLVTDLGASLRF